MGPTEIGKEPVTQDEQETAAVPVVEETAV
jgi:hypothetical protein